ncbi:MAG TPA: DUF2721 domain-containing protein [Candidatus Acidoferrales bacterium]|nr:DUF2721 domain-containing protein [Candidatus Acidoferrales bacterium]
MTIQDVLAPAVMITGVALLLLTFTARHSVLVNRIRLLDDEKRHLNERLASSKNLDKTEEVRLKSIKDQLNLLLSRLAYVRNGMLCLLLAVLFFVLTSFSIGLSLFPIPSESTQIAISVTFTLGMLLVLAGVAFLALEIFVSDKVIVVEVTEELESGTGNEI